MGYHEEIGINWNSDSISLLAVWRGSALFLKTRPIVHTIACGYIEGNELSGLLVDGDYRRQGIGSLIVSLREHRIRTLGYSEAKATVHPTNTAMQRLLGRQGYNKSGTKSTEFGEYWIYVKTLEKDNGTRSPQSSRTE